MIPVTTPQTTVSTITAPHRLIGTPSACRVTPDEYRSIVLVANSWKMAKIRNGTTNQAGKLCGTPSWVMPTVFLVTVKASTPRTSSSTDGIPAPRAADQNVLVLGVLRGR